MLICLRRSASRRALESGEQRVTQSGASHEDNLYGYILQALILGDPNAPRHCAFTLPTLKPRATAEI